MIVRLSRRGELMATSKEMVGDRRQATRHVAEMLRLLIRSPGRRDAGARIAERGTAAGRPGSTVSPRRPITPQIDFELAARISDWVQFPAQAIRDGVALAT